MKSLGSKLDRIKFQGSITCLFTEHNHNYRDLLQATCLPIYFSHPHVGKPVPHFFSPSKKVLFQLPVATEYRNSHAQTRQDPRATSFAEGGKGSPYAGCCQCTTFELGREGGRESCGGHLTKKSSGRLSPMLTHAFQGDTISYQPGNPA